LAAIFPFYVGLGVDLRSLRAFRLIRLVRVFKLVRYSAALTRLHRALMIAKEEIILYLGVGAILLYLSAVGIYYFERDAQPEAFASVIHSLWWAVTTLTTVGYGDIYPITTGGRIFTFFVLLIGLGVVAVPAGLVASSLSKARELDDSEPPSNRSESNRR
jgi:voltage-gated potassium channel